MKMKWTKRFRDRGLATANKVVCIHWVDSYGSGCWEPIKDQRPQLLNVVSIGYLVGETEYTYSISSTYADETEDTPEQAFGYYINDDIAKSQVAYLFLTGEYTKALQLQNELEKNRAKLKRAGYGVMSKYSEEEILKAIDFLDKTSNSVQEE